MQTRDNPMDLTTISGTAKLEANIQDRLGSQIRDFQLVLAEKGLVLRGHAHTYYVKQLAQHAVLEAKGLPILAHEIEVS